MTHNVTSFQDHVLILGDGALTTIISETLGEEVDHIVITSDQDRARALAEQDIKVLTGDPGTEEMLRRGDIQAARAVIVATDSDAEDAMAILTARDLNPTVSIIAAATNSQNVPKFERAGADRVLSPAVLGAKLLVRSAVDGSSRTDRFEETDWTGVVSERLDEDH